MCCTALFVSYHFRLLARLNPTACDAMPHYQEIKQNPYYCAKIVGTQLQSQKKKFFSVITVKHTHRKTMYFKKKYALIAEHSVAQSIAANHITGATINL